MNAPISRDIALRIGLAAHELPDEISIAELIGFLDATLGNPLTIEGLSGLTMKTFRKAAGERLMAVPVEMQKRALACLRGEGLAAQDDPEILPYKDKDMPGSLRIACASNGGERLDGHFGTCLRFLVYQVSASEIRLVDIRSCANASEAEDKNAWRAKLISDCQVVEMISIGGPAAAKVVRANIHPLKRADATDARVAMEELQAVIGGTPAPWLARAMGQEPNTLKPFLEGATS